MKDWLEIFKIDASSEQLLPYADEGIQAGFPSPAQDYMELSYDLNKEYSMFLSKSFYEFNIFLTSVNLAL